MKKETVLMGAKIPIGVVCSDKFILNEIYKMSDIYDIHVINLKTYDKNEINYWVEYCKKHNIASVSAFENQELYFQTIINEMLGASSLSKEGCLFAINKFLNRTLEVTPFWYDEISLADTDTEILSKIKSYPCMLKSTLHNSGAYIFKINDEAELVQKIYEFNNTRDGASLINNQENYLSFCSEDEIPDQFPYLIVEEFIDIKANIKQFSIDCFATSTGDFRPFVVREELYFPTLQKIGYLCPPVSLDKKQLLQIENFVIQIGKKFEGKRFVNQFFNIECWLTEKEEFYLAEINVVPNTNFVGMYDRMEKKSLMNIILDLQHSQIIPKNTPFEAMKAGTLDKYYLQSQINCVVKGKIKDIFDFVALQDISKNENYYLMPVVEDENFEFTDLHMSTPGWPVAEIYHEGHSIEELLQQDRKLRSLIYK